jgi:hypothetical protein
MTIQPTKPGSTPTAGTNRLDRNAALSPARPVDTSNSEVTSPAPDKVQISDAARGLQEQLQNRLELVSQLPPTGSTTVPRSAEPWSGPSQRN